jgi:hypothetical protein
MRSPVGSDFDELGAPEIGRLEALVEHIDAALADGRMEDKRGASACAHRLAAGRLSPCCRAEVERAAVRELARSRPAPARGGLADERAQVAGVTCQLGPPIGPAASLAAVATWTFRANAPRK